MTLTPEQKAEGWIEWNGGDCPVKCNETLLEVLLRCGVRAEVRASVCRWTHLSTDGDIVAYRIIEAHGADAEPARPTPFPASYDDLVFSHDGWSQTIIVDGKRPEWLRDDDRCSHATETTEGWKASCWEGEELAIRVRRREPKRETVQCRLYISEQAHPIAWSTIDLIDGKPDLSTLKIAEDAL